MGRNMGITLYLIAKKHVYTHMPTYVYIHTHTHIHGKEFNFVTCLTSLPNLIILTFNTSFISYNLLKSLIVKESYIRLESVI